MTVLPKLTILGVDPGSVCTGWGVLWGEGNSIRYVASGAIKLPKTAPRIEKLRLIHLGLFQQILPSVVIRRPESCFNRLRMSLLKAEDLAASKRS